MAGDQNTNGNDPQDVVDLLLSQHAQIEDLFRDVLTFTGQDKQDAFEELVRLLSVHETAEEEIVHPLARAGDDSDAVDARLEEEREAKELLKALYEDGTGAAGFDTRLLELRNAVLAHAKREERYEFPKLRQLHSGGRLVAAAAAVRAAEAVAPTRPHPGVESATKNALLGGPTAIIDRARDALREATRS